MRCQVEIPGLGQCEVEGEHTKVDSLGRLVHVIGACSWNGGNLIEVDDKALRDQAREDRESRERTRDEDGWPSRWSDPAYLGDGPWGA